MRALVLSVVVSAVLVFGLLVIAVPASAADYPTATFSPGTSGNVVMRRDGRLAAPGVVGNPGC